VIICQSLGFALLPSRLLARGGGLGRLFGFVSRKILAESAEGLNVELGLARRRKREIEKGRRLVKRELCEDLLGGVHVLRIDERDRRDRVAGPLLGEQVGEF
jgi:hypothetical protein